VFTDEVDSRSVRLTRNVSKIRSHKKRFVANFISWYYNGLDAVSDIMNEHES
jgi:hypothetical protein